MLELDCEQAFDPTRDAEFFAALPKRPGIVLLEMRDPHAQPYLVRTADIRRVAERLLSIPDVLSKRLNLRDVAARLRYRIAGSKFEQMLAHYQQARAYFPGRYRDLVRMRPPAMLKVNLRSDYPRCYVTRRMRGDEGFYFGPFASRKAADAFGEAFLDLFKIRRCQIKIRRDPSFPGCIYSEMKMCLAPCFAGCTKEQYGAEVGRVLETLQTTGTALTQEVEREREGASEALDFEHAAALHRRLEKISSVLRGLPQLARRIEELDAVILQRAAEEKTVVGFPVLGGILREPIFLRFGELSSEPRSVEAILRAGLERPADERGRSGKVSEGRNTAIPQSPEGRRRRFGLQEAPEELNDHLSLLARWFYSSPREGEIFFRAADWPYRRILRSCSRILTPAPDAGDPVQSFPVRDDQASRERIKRLRAFSKARRKPAK